MSESKIPLKDPWLAGLLALLVPGAGHLYQGRMFKGVLYFFCILGTFFYGLHLGEWKIVYFRRGPGNTTYGYFAQMLTGLSAWPAFVQARRWQDPDNQRATMLESPLDEPFTGLMEMHRPGGEVLTAPISGRIRLEPVEGPFGPEVEGVFTGTRGEGDAQEAIELQLAGLVLERPVWADPGRTLTSDIVGHQNGEQQVIGQVAGVIPRQFWNWFEVPLADEGPQHVPGLLGEFLDRYERLDNLQALNGRLGKFYELALVYTWIAGLLNILAIWDACQGPAYGYREDEAERESTNQATPRSSKKSADVQVAARATSQRHSDDGSQAEPHGQTKASQPADDSRET